MRLFIDIYFHGIASGGVLVHAFSLSPSGQEVYSGTIIRWFAIFAGVTITTNFYAICAIGYRIWHAYQSTKIFSCYNHMALRIHHRQMKDLGDTVVIGGGKHFSALFLLIESGAIYCVALVRLLFKTPILLLTVFTRSLL